MVALDKLLMIPAATLKDIGTYSCVAENGVDSILSTSIFVAVQSKLIQCSNLIMVSN